MNMHHTHILEWHKIKFLKDTAVVIELMADGIVKWKIVQSVVDNNMGATIERESK